MDYLGEYAYPSAKALLQSRYGFRRGIATLLDQCRDHYPSELWDVLASYDYESEYKRFEKAWPGPRSRSRAREDVEVFFLALEDVPYGFDLRGSTRWSADPDDWEWWYDDDYFGPYIGSKLMKFAFEQAEAHDSEEPPQRAAAKNSWEVMP